MESRARYEEAAGYFGCVKESSGQSGPSQDLHLSVIGGWVGGLGERAAVQDSSRSHASSTPMGGIPSFDLFEELYPSSLKSNQSDDLNSIRLP